MNPKQKSALEFSIAAAIDADSAIKTAISEATRTREKLSVILKLLCGYLQPTAVKRAAKRAGKRSRG
jgi:hypothetical protein